MKSDFPQVAILGGGLLGGSLALALPRLEEAPAVRLWARRQHSVEEALNIGITDVTSDLAEAVAGANLVVLAVPVGAMPELARQAIAAGLPADALVTDVGSVKGAPHATLEPIFKPHGISFIGSHPMAGSERNGLAAATGRLFQGAACLLTNDGHASAAKAAALERFWQAIGCRTTWMSAPVHDELVARISHLPHVLAASGARVCLKDPAEGRFGGGGLRDTTRVAGGNPSMWAEILTENREAIIGPLRETLADLGEILAILEKGDQEKARRWLAAGKKQRDSLSTPR